MVAMLATPYQSPLGVIGRTFHTDNALSLRMRKRTYLDPSKMDLYGSLMEIEISRRLRLAYGTKISRAAMSS